jgi:hypothetical protein
MGDAGRGAGFTPRPPARGFVAVAADRLQGNGTLEPLVAGRVDDAHPTLPNFPLDPVTAYPVGCRRRSV